MHCGRQKPLADYTLTQDGQTTKLQKTSKKRDLDTIVQDTMKPTCHCQQAASRGMSALRRLKTAFMSIDINFKPLYNTYVRPHLEYCVQAVGPYMAQDYEALERVQRRATKLIQGLTHISYEERFHQLNMHSIKRHVLYGDLIETFKILGGKTKLDPAQFFEEDWDTRTRGHEKKTQGQENITKIQSHVLLE